TRHEGPPGPIVQVYRDTAEGTTLARSFQHAMRQRGHAPIQDVILNDGCPAKEFWQRAVHNHSPSQLVLWLAPGDLNSYVPDRAAKNHRFAIYLSSSLLGRSPMSIPDSLRGRVCLTYPQTLPGHEGPDIFRVRSWFRSQGMALDYQRIQLNTYLALSVS